MSHDAPAHLRRQSLRWALAALLGGVVGLTLLSLRVRPAETKDVQPQFAGVPEAQARRVRLWQSFDWNEIGRIGAAEGLLQPAFLNVGIDGSLSVLDAEDYSIKTIRPPGVVVRTRSIPERSLARSFIPLTDMKVDAEGTIWLSNPNGELVGVTEDGAERHGLRGVYKIAPLRKALLVMEGSGRPHLFAVYSASGRALSRFGTVLASQERDGIAIDGEVAIDQGSERVVFGPYYGGFLVSYDTDGRRRFLTATIDAPPLPRVRIVEGGVLASKPATDAVKLIDLSVFDDSVYVLMSVPDPKGIRQSVVDIYESEHGQYVESIKLPQRCTEIVASQSIIYAACQGSVVLWSRAVKSRATTS